VPYTPKKLLIWTLRRKKKTEEESDRNREKKVEGLEGNAFIKGEKTIE